MCSIHKITVTILLISCISYALAFTDLELFNQFKQKYNRHYSSEEENQKRFKTFQENLVRIVQLNLYETTSAKYGVTQFADLNPVEFITQFAGGLLPASTSSPPPPPPLEPITPPKISLPKSFSWKDHGVVSPVKDQAQCGACYAFTTTSAMESQMLKNTGQYVSFSEEQLVNCDPKNLRCGGAYYMRDTYRYIIAAGGIETEQQYPYTATEAECQAVPGSKRVTITNAYQLAENDDVTMAQALLTYGPFITAYDANSLQLYMGGVIGLTNPLGLPICCAFEECLNHVVLVIGYGVEQGILGETKHWIMKNSWGESWGEGGYFRIDRGSNMCGCETDSNVLEMYGSFV